MLLFVDVSGDGDGVFSVAVIVVLRLLEVIVVLLLEVILMLFPAVKFESIAVSV